MNVVTKENPWIACDKLNTIHRPVGCRCTCVVHFVAFYSHGFSYAVAQQTKLYTHCHSLFITRMHNTEFLIDSLHNNFS